MKWFIPSFLKIIKILDIVISNGFNLWKAL